jgi:rubrerythrin
VNLAKSFAGESQARTRYAIYAERARKDGFAYIANIFEYIAGQELAHANMFLRHLNADTNQPPNNIVIDTGYPYESGDTLANLQGSSRHEREEAELIYPPLRKTPSRRVFCHCKAFQDIASVETLHSGLEEALHTAMAQESCITSKRPLYGNAPTAAMKPARRSLAHLPLCAHNRGFVIRSRHEILTNKRFHQAESIIYKNNLW